MTSTSRLAEPPQFELVGTFTYDALGNIVVTPTTEAESADQSPA